MRQVLEFHANGINDVGQVVGASDGQAFLWEDGVMTDLNPATVAALIREQFELSGGFGTLLQLGSDYSDDGERQKWFRSMELLANEVMPRVNSAIGTSVGRARAAQ